MAARRVVHGEELDSFHAYTSRPAHKTAQVAEITNSATVFAAQGKHRHDHTGQPWQNPSHSCPDVVAAFPAFSSVCPTVTTLLPLDGTVHMQTHIFIFKSLPGLTLRESKNPTVSSHRLQAPGIAYVPSAQFRSRTEHGPRLAFGEIGRREAEQETASDGKRRRRLASGKPRHHPRHVAIVPTVGQFISTGPVFDQKAVALATFGRLDGTVPDYAVRIRQASRTVYPYASGPEETVGCGEPAGSRSQKSFGSVQRIGRFERLTPTRAIIYLKTYCHHVATVKNYVSWGCQQKKSTKKPSRFVY